MTLAPRRARAAAALLLAATLPGCPQSIGTAPDGDAPTDVGRPDGDGDALDAAAPDATAPDADDVPHVQTCSEIAIRTVTASPSSGGRAYPGSHLTLTGDALDTVVRVVVGGVEQPFQRSGDALTVDVPPMLAVGSQAVTVATDRCMTSAQLTVSRLLAVARANTGSVELRDLTDLAAVGTLDTGLPGLAQGQFSLDGTSFLALGTDHRMVRLGTAGAGPATLLAPFANAPFTLAQGTTVPTSGLLAMRDATPRGLWLFDSLAGSAAPIAPPPADPLTVSLSLDGFRALELESDGDLYVGERPLTRSATWQRQNGWTALAGATEAVLSQAPHAGTEHLGVVFATSAGGPQVVPIDALGGRVGAPVPLPGAAGRVRFIAGDIVVLEAVTPEVLAVDITDLMGDVWRLPLAGEAASPIDHTQLAITLYKLGALVLRPSGAASQADVLHVLDFQTEPPQEQGQFALPGMRGVVGVQGQGNPFVVWTARSVVRVLGDQPDGASAVRTESDPAAPDVAFVAIQP